MSKEEQKEEKPLRLKEVMEYVRLIVIVIGVNAFPASGRPVKGAIPSSAA